MDENCIFCKIAAGQIPSDLVYQDEEVVAFKDLHPQAPKHILIIPKRHLTSMAELTLEDGPLLAKLFAVATQTAQQQGLNNGYRLVTNVGRDGGQTVAHLHFHLLGGRQMTWPPG